MADIDHQRGVAAAAPQDHLESTAATTETTGSAADDDDGCFTFAAASPLMAGGGEFAESRIGPVYPVFGRARSLSEEEDPSSATVRVPLALLLLAERGSPTSPSGQPDDEGELDGVPAETYCLWSPGASPSPARSPARCSKSGSTGSVLRWRRRLLGRSDSDGKEKFVFVDTSSERDADGGHHGWKDHGRDAKGGGGNGGGRRSFLPSKKDLVGLFANAGAFRRSYHPF